MQKNLQPTLSDEDKLFAELFLLFVVMVSIVYLSLQLLLAGADHHCF
jgi:hypothetical protein